jgi:outer membrane protein TolC
MATDFSLSPILRTAAVLCALGVLNSIVSAQTILEPPELTLKDCIEDVLLNNLSLQADRVDPKIAQEETEVAKGEFDPAVNVTANTRTVQRSTSSSNLDCSGWSP